MNGAQALMETLKRSGVSVCFANPGTSEMHMVRALDEGDGIRAVLALFEGVATGAADGFARMTGRPAATILHLGPGLANGLANLHNARRASSPVVNLVGDHPDYHQGFDAPLTSDIATLAKPMSCWVGRPSSAADLPRKGAEAAAAALAPPGGVATLVVPADCAWTENVTPSDPVRVPKRAVPDGAQIDKALGAIRKAKKIAFLLSGHALSERALYDAARAAKAVDAALYVELFSARVARGAGRVTPLRMPYFPEQIVQALNGVDCLVLAGARAPVAFFAYPNTPSELTPKGAEVVTLAAPQDDCEAALAMLAEALGAPPTADVAERKTPVLMDGALTPESAATAIARFLPENAIVSDESATSGLNLWPLLANAAPHDLLSLTGGSIGQGLPLAVGAAVACPERKVVCLHGDGGAMYTLQALWTMAREKLDVTTVIWSNRSYRILGVELMRAGATNPGPTAMGLVGLDNPPLDWTQLAKGMGVNAASCNNARSFAAAFESAMSKRGPMLIEAIV